MSLFTWKNEYLLGRADIDAQHQRLFQLADKLHEAMSAGKGSDVLAKTLGDLIDYTKLHFAAEEKLMQDSRYPDFAAHKAQHDKLTARVVEFQKNFGTGKSSMTIQLLQFLKDWLSHHIGETDRKVAQHLRTKAA
jgi:hemerythrin-like metal-binding protein